MVKMFDVKVELRPDLEERLEKASLNKDSKNLMRLYGYILQLGDELKDDLFNGRLRISPKHLLETITMYYFPHCLHMGLGIFDLSEKRLASAAAVLSRTILESLIDLSYLWLCKRINVSSNEREAWCEYELCQRGETAHSWDELRRKAQVLGIPEPDANFNIDKLDEYISSLKHFRETYKRKHWAIHHSLKTRAAKVDEIHALDQFGYICLEEEYVNLYMFLSRRVHGSSASSGSYITVNESGYVINCYSSESETQAILAIAARLLIRVWCIIAHINHIKTEKFTNIERDLGL